jgi:Ca2+-transporting ATPase
LPSTNIVSEEAQWSEGIQRSIDNLKTYTSLRGGRARSANILKKRAIKKEIKAQGIQPSALMVMMPSLVLGSVGAGWKPQGGSLSDPAGSDPSPSTAHLAETGEAQWKV